MQSYFKVKNEFGLSGENLEYFQDIEYLKELTKQATALMSRSNAVYNNILNELEVGQSITGPPNKTNRSETQEDGRCDLCGLNHGANYCILKEIMSEEESKDTRSENPRYNRFFSKSTRNLRECRTNFRNSSSPSNAELFRQKETPVKLPIFEKLSPEKLLDSYEMVCTRYGKNNGQRFLLAHSLASKVEEKTKTWTVPCDARPNMATGVPPKMTYKTIERECFSEPPQLNPLCKDYSDEVRKKVEQLVELRPPCEAEAFETRKNWKDIFKKHRQAVKKDTSIHSNHSRETSLSQTPQSQPPICRCLLENCDCVGEVTCSSPPKYQCTGKRDDNYESNYLITIRNRLDRRRYTRNMRATATSKDAQTIIKKSRKPSNFLTRSLDEQANDLRDCLIQATHDTQLLTDNTFKSNVDHVADLTSPIKMLDEDTWQNWMVAYDRKEAMYDSDEYTDFGDSDILSEHSGLSEHSKESDIEYKDDQKLFHTRIPYAEETWRLTDILFDKISRKFGKSIHKNTFRVDRLWFKPTFAHLMRTVKMLETTNKIFYDISQDMSYFRLYSKRLTPLLARKQFKLKRMRAWARSIKKLDNRRKWSQGIQIGKQFVRPDKEIKYTRDGDFEGFSTRRYEYLVKPESHRIKSYNLVGDNRGRTITKKTIHKDFRFIRNLFGLESEYQRDFLMDEGMKKRLEKYRRKVRGLSDDRLPPPPQFISNIVETMSEESLGMAGQSVPHKEEMGLEQTLPSKRQSGRRDRGTTELDPINRKTRMLGLSCESQNKEEMRVGSDSIRNQRVPALSDVDDRRNTEDIQSGESNNLVASTAERPKRNELTSVRPSRKTSSGVVAPHSVSNLKQCHNLVKSQNQMSDCRTSSNSSVVQSIENTCDKSQTINPSHLSLSGSQMSRPYKRNLEAPSHQMKNRLTTQESLPRIKTLFDNRIVSGYSRNEPSPNISAATKRNRSVILSE